MSATFFGTNVKMHQSPSESVAYIDALAMLSHDRALQLFVILPFTSLSSVVERAHRAGIWVGGQNMHWADAGEYTGEVSASMLRDSGVDLVLLGHAERRQAFNESDLEIRRKVEAALAHGLRVLLCVGETADERRFAAGGESIVRQLKMGLHGLADLTNVMIAYEPVWAIGEAGTAPDAATISEAAGVIRAWCGSLPLLYGGSVTAESARGYAGVAGIDGLFVGRSARSPAGFAQVAAVAYPTMMHLNESPAVHSPREEGRFNVDHPDDAGRR